MGNPYANLVQLLNAITLLSQPSGTTIKALMERLEVSRRTVFRLLEALDELGFPLVHDRPEFGGEKIYRLLDSFIQRLPNISLPGFSFSPREAIYLKAILDRSHFFPDPESDSALTSLRLKLKTIIKEQTTSSLSGTPRQIGSGCLVQNDAGESILISIRTAIFDHRACAIRYRAFEPSSSQLYVIHPLRLIEDAGGFFLFAGLPSHDAVRLIPVDRISSIDILENVCTSDGDQSADILLAKAFDLGHPAPVTVVIRLSASISQSMHQRRLSPDQSIIDHPDGSCTMTVSTSDSAALLQYLLSFGPNAEIISPPEIRALARKQLSEALFHYKNARPLN